MNTKALHKLGAPFAALPDDRVCPVCGAEKSKFEEVS
jgi:rubredoxin